MAESTTKSTRDRILDAAELLFAEQGFGSTSLRAITAAAKVNLAAVNYHFGNKENLYLSVFRDRWVPRAMRIQARVQESLKLQDEVSAGSVVRAVAQAFIEGPLTDEERQRHSQLMAREMSRPTKAFELVANEVMKPFFEK